jgi:hypothetical protein
VIAEHKELNGSSYQDGAGARVERARRARSSGEKQHDTVLHLDRQELLVGRPQVQTPRCLDWSGDGEGWTEIGGRLGATDRVRDGHRDWPGL